MYYLGATDEAEKATEKAKNFIDTAGSWYQKLVTEPKSALEKIKAEAAKAKLELAAKQQPKEKTNYVPIIIGGLAVVSIIAVMSARGKVGR